MVAGSTRLIRADIFEFNSKGCAPAAKSIEFEEQIMSYARKNMKNLSVSIVGVIIIVAIAVWQFYQFVNFKDASGIADMQGGSMHLWWAIAMAVFACIAGVLVFSVFLKHDSDDELHITSSPRSARSWTIK